MTAPDRLPAPEPVARPWSWEGNVQSKIVGKLKSEGWRIVQAVNTASRDAGKDIVAERDGKTLWVTVKGFPAGTPKTSPTTQARHWFARATFDVVLWRGEDAETHIAVGLPKKGNLRAAGETNGLVPADRQLLLHLGHRGRDSVGSGNRSIGRSRCWRACSATVEVGADCLMI